MHKGLYFLRKFCKMLSMASKSNKISISSLVRFGSRAWKHLEPCCAESAIRWNGKLQQPEHCCKGIKIESRAHKWFQALRKYHEVWRTKFTPRHPTQSSGQRFHKGPCTCTLYAPDALRSKNKNSHIVKGLKLELWICAGSNLAGSPFNRKLATHLVMHLPGLQCIYALWCVVVLKSSKATAPGHSGTQRSCNTCMMDHHVPRFHGAELPRAA